MFKGTVESAILAVLSFILGQYFGVECADYLIAAVICPPFRRMRFGASLPQYERG